MMVCATCVTMLRNAYKSRYLRGKCSKFSKKFTFSLKLTKKKLSSRLAWKKQTLLSVRRLWGRRMRVNQWMNGKASSKWVAPQWRTNTRIKSSTHPCAKRSLKLLATSANFSKSTVKKPASTLMALLPQSLDSVRQIMMVNRAKFVRHWRKILN